MKKLLALFVLTGIVNLAAAADASSNAKPVAKSVADLTALCIGCHAIPNYKATFPEVYRVPLLGGQSAKYIESALQAYKKGDRKNPSMRGIAGSLSDQEITAIANYYAQQK